MSTTILERTAAEAREQKAAAQFRYRAVVLAIAKGDDPGAAEISAALTGVGERSVNLADDVEQARQRLEDQQRLTNAKALVAERPNIEAELESAKAKLDAALKAHDKAAAGPLARLRRVEQAENDLHFLTSDLWKTCPDEALAVELADVVEAHKVACEQRGVLAKRIGENQRECEFQKRAIDEQGPISRQGDDRKAMVKSLERRIKEDSADLAPLPAEIAKLAAREIELRERMLWA